VKALVVLALLGCNRPDDPRLEPPAPPPQQAPPAPRKLQPADRTITYDPYAVGVDAEPEEARLPPTPPGQLDAERGKLIVAELNELCGDIWCEGEYNFTFTSMTCVRGACQLAFKAKHYESDKAFTDTIKFDFFDRAADADGATQKLHRAIGDAIRVWERRHKR
jgi:hypothetical protein